MCVFHIYLEFRFKAPLLPIASSGGICKLQPLLANSKWSSGLLTHSSQRKLIFFLTFEIKSFYHLPALWKINKK